MHTHAQSAYTREYVQWCTPFLKISNTWHMLFNIFTHLTRWSPTVDWVLKKSLTEWNTVKIFCMMLYNSQDTLTCSIWLDLLSLVGMSCQNLHLYGWGSEHQKGRGLGKGHSAKKWCRTQSHCFKLQSQCFFSSAFQSTCSMRPATLPVFFTPLSSVPRTAADT